VAWIDAIIRAFHEVAWPGAAAWIAWYFRDAIVAQLPRVTKVGPVTLDPPAPNQAVKKVSSEEIIKKVEGSVPPELLDEARKTIKEKFPHSNDDDLLTLSGALLISGMFERTYALIFGSQILFLERLNASPLTVEDAKGFYERATAIFGEIYKSYSFDQWLNFMESFTLLSKTPDNQLQITQRGRGFLSYLVENGYSTQRAG
jgi:hypothetical protein